MDNTELFNLIQAKFAAGKRVLVSTYLKTTVYSAKHAKMFKAPTKVTERGVYVQHGRRWDYVFPQYIKFEK